MQAVDLETAGKIMSLVLQVSGIVIGLLLVAGYIFYLGRRVGNRLELRETPPYEFKMELATIGVIVCSFFLLLLILSASVYYVYQFPEMEILDKVVFFVGFSVWFIYLGILMIKKEEKEPVRMGKIFFLFILLISVWIITINKPLLQYLLLGLFLAGFLYLIYYHGRRFGEEELTHLATVEVVLIDGREERLKLYQTTNIDYRFKGEDGKEVIIPRERVKKIIYTPEKDKREV